MSDPDGWNTFLEQWSALVVVVAAALAVVWKGIKTVWHMAQNLNRLVDVVNEQLVNGNGGSTLKDQLDAMVVWRESDDEMRQRRQAEHDVWRSQVSSRFDQLEARQSQILERLSAVELEQSKFDPPEGSPV